MLYIFGFYQTDKLIKEINSLLQFEYLIMVTFNAIGMLFVIVVVVVEFEGL